MKHVPSANIQLTFQVRKSGWRREDGEGQKQDGMWHLPPLQRRGRGQVINVFQDVFKGERAESWIEEL